MEEAGPGPGSEPGLRAAGRSNLQIRTLVCERGLLSRADGSARWNQDKTSVIAAVYGPRQTLGRKEDAEKAVLEVIFRPKNGYGSSRDKQYEQILLQTLEGVVLLHIHPRTLISIVIQEVGNDGSLLSCAINAACAALTDAAIPMKALIVGATCAFSPSGLPLVDPDFQEEQEAQAVAMVSYTGRLLKPEDTQATLSEGILSSLAVGTMAVEDFLRLRDLSRRCCERIIGFVRVSSLRELQ